MPVLDFDRTARENDERCRDDESETDDAAVRKLSIKVFYSFTGGQVETGERYRASPHPSKGRRQERG